MHAGLATAENGAPPVPHGVANQPASTAMQTGREKRALHLGPRKATHRVWVEVRAFPVCLPSRRRGVNASEQRASRVEPEFLPPAPKPAKETPAAGFMSCTPREGSLENSTSRQGSRTGACLAARHETTGRRPATAAERRRERQRESQPEEGVSTKPCWGRMRTASRPPSLLRSKLTGFGKHHLEPLPSLTRRKKKKSGRPSPNPRHVSWPGPKKVRGGRGRDRRAISPHTPTTTTILISGLEMAPISHHGGPTIKERQPRGFRRTIVRLATA